MPSAAAEPAPPAAARIIAGIRGDKAQREAAYAQLDALARGGDSDSEVADVAAACIRPLIETVFAADVSVVDAAEFRRAHLLLLELFMLEPLRLIGEWTRNLRLGIAWGTPGNAWAAVFDKEPSELTRDDVLVLAAVMGGWASLLARGA